MSAGVFQRFKYAASYGAGTAIHPIRCQPETVLASCDGTANGEPSGALNNPISATISKGKRQKGLIPRKITIQSSGASPPSGYKTGSITTIPALTPAFYTKASAAGAVVTYLNTTWSVVSASPEVAK